MLEAVLLASCLLLILILKEDLSLPPLANPIIVALSFFFFLKLTQIGTFFLQIL